MAAVWTTISAQHDIERVLDRRLRESAHMVASLGSVAVAAPIPKLPIAPAADFERQLSCQIWSVRGALLGRSSSAPSQPKLGRASCRERVCQYVSISVVAGSLKKKNDIEIVIELHPVNQHTQ